ncbi:hypothetical protein BC830DRAFT_1219341 [Chytriomyces sp. MP71]|nr:hypothetical protein BC830DRAFT_1219341 [Chytriomyces sp. MP71]
MRKASFLTLPLLPCFGMRKMVNDPTFPDRGDARTGARQRSLIRQEEKQSRPTLTSRYFFVKVSEAQVPSQLPLPSAYKSPKGNPSTPQEESGQTVDSAGVGASISLSAVEESAVALLGGQVAAVVLGHVGAGLVADGPSKGPTQNLVAGTFQWDMKRWQTNSSLHSEQMLMV